MSDNKVIVFRSKHELHRLYMGEKKIKFVKGHFKTNDEKEIAFLRKFAEKNPAIREIKPEQKAAAIIINDGETEEEALERALSEKKGKSAAKAKKEEPAKKVEDTSKAEEPKAEDKSDSKTNKK